MYVHVGGRKLFEQSRVSSRKKIFGGGGGGGGELPL